MPPDSSSPYANAAPRGILLSLAAFALFTAMDCTVKVLGARYHLVQVVWLQTLVMFLLLLAPTFRHGGLSRLRTQQWRLHALRGLLTIVSINAAFYSYVTMPLADVYAVLFTVPLLVTGLSVPFLGETVGLRRWTAVLVGFSGVLLMIRPGDGVLESAVLAPLAAAVATAAGFILVRKLQATETTESMGVYGNVAMLVLMAPMVPPVFQTPTWLDLSLSVLGGSLGAMGFALLVRAYRAAPAAVIAPFQYSQMPFALVAGLTLFGDRPEPMVLVGAGIVAASGVYILHRENKRRAMLMAAAAGPAQPAMFPAQASQ